MPPSQHKRTQPTGRCRSAHASPLGVARRDRPDRHEIRPAGIAQCGACTVHIDGGRDAGPCLGPDSGAHRRQGRSQTIRGARRGTARWHKVQPGPGSTTDVAAMRLLPERDDHGGRRAAQGQPDAKRRPISTSTITNILPLRHLSAGARGDPRPAACQKPETGACHDRIIASQSPLVSRRLPPAIGGGLSLGFRIPFGLAAAAGRRRRAPR